MERVSVEEFKLSKIEAAWKEILKNSKSHDIGNTFEWNRCWWDTYFNLGVAKKEPFILGNANNGKIIAIWPFFIRHRYGMRIIHWIGQADGMTTDYMCVVSAEEEKDKAARDLIKFLSGNNTLWDVADLRIPSWAGLIEHLIKNLVLYGETFNLHWQARVADHAVVLEMPGDFEKYLATLGRKTRSDIRQYLRSAAQNGVGLKIYHGNEISAWIPVLFELSSLNWGMFHNEKSRQFIIDVVTALATGKENVVFAVLTHDTKAIGSVLGFESGATCYLHPAGVLRQEVAGVSPGITMYVMIVESLIKRGFRKLDLSPGLEEYKFRLGGHVEPVHQFLIWHNKSKINRWRLFDWVRRMKMSRLRISTNTSYQKIET
jgi:CelD/BcsL family acetyltransferase involved in cellulose biosynthesis